LRFRKLSRIGLGTIVASLILLSAAVLLTVTASRYATSVTRSRSSGEEMRINKEKLWMDGSGAVVAFKAENIGSKELIVIGVTVRKVEMSWDSIYCYMVPLRSTFSDELSIMSDGSLTGDYVIVDGMNFTRSEGYMPFKIGESALFYIKGPPNIHFEDIGTEVDLGLITLNGHFMSTVTIESATKQ